MVHFDKLFQKLLAMIPIQTIPENSTAYSMLLIITELREGGQFIAKYNHGYT